MCCCFSLQQTSFPKYNANKTGRMAKTNNIYHDIEHCLSGINTEELHPCNTLLVINITGYVTGDSSFLQVRKTIGWASENKQIVP